MSKDFVKSFLEELVSKMSVSYDEVFIEEQDDKTRVVVKTKEPDMLIGYKGEHFWALSHITKRAISQKLGEDHIFKFSVDVNDYKESEANSIRNKALVMADRAVSFKIDVEMEPMSSYDRLIVHSTLQGKPCIRTESIGLGRERRVVVKFMEGINIEKF